jgi:hypothetical protein
MTTHITVCCHDDNFFEMGNVCLMPFKKILPYCSLSHNMAFSGTLLSADEQLHSVCIMIADNSVQQKNSLDTEYSVIIHYYY